MASFSVEKSIHIEAPRERVFEEVRDFRKWPSWSPWLLAEPDSKLTFSADGNSYSWVGNIVGSGQIDVLGDAPPASMNCRLTFLKPWKAVSTTSFDLRDADGGTQLTWKMEGSLPFFLAWMKNTMAAVIGMDYQRGLNMIKEKVETGEVGFDLETGRKDVAGFSYIGISSECEVAEIGPSMSAAFDKLQEYFSASGLEQSGKAFAIYHKWDIVKQRCRYTCGYPVAGAPSAAPFNFVSGTVPSHKAYTVTLTGPYSHLSDAWSVGMMHERSKVFSQDKSIDPFETYENNADEVGEKDLLTVVHIPMKA